MHNNKKESCLVSRFRCSMEINDAEEQLLRGLEKDNVSFNSRVKLHLQNLSSNLYVLKSGWIYRYVDLPDGKRQVLRIHLPGEIIGLNNVAMQASFNEVMTVTEVVVCPFPREALMDIFRQSPRLSALLFSLGMREEAILMERIKMMGSYSAVNCVANFMLELRTRLRLISHGQELKTFHMPLTQEVIADVLGLTNVTVSNAFAQLHDEGKMSYKRNTVTIHGINKLKTELKFNDHHFRIDTSLFPT